MVLAQILLACIAGSVLSLALAAIAAFRVKSRWVPTLVSYAVGALLGAVFLDLLPHIFGDTKNPARVAAFILFGILAFFVLEKLLLWRHHHGDEEHEGHSHEVGHDSGRSGWMITTASWRYSRGAAHRRSTVTSTISSERRGCSSRVTRDCA